MDLPVKGQVELGLKHQSINLKFLQKIVGVCFLLIVLLHNTLQKLFEVLIRKERKMCEQWEGNFGFHCC